jgi:hypothetical protein
VSSPTNQSQCPGRIRKVISSGEKVLTDESGRPVLILGPCIEITSPKGSSRKPVRIPTSNKAYEEFLQIALGKVKKEL